VIATTLAPVLMPLASSVAASFARRSAEAGSASSRRGDRGRAARWWMGRGGWPRVSAGPGGGLSVWKAARSTCPGFGVSRVESEAWPSGAVERRRPSAVE
jgi:hypothetical protein